MFGAKYFALNSIQMNGLLAAMQTVHQRQRPPSPQPLRIA